MADIPLSTGEDSNGPMTAATGAFRHWCHLDPGDSGEPSLVAEDLRGAAGTVPPERRFRIQSLLAGEHDREGRPYDAIRRYEESLETATECDAPDPILSAIVHNNLGTLYGRFNDSARAERHFLAAMELFEGAAGGDDPRFAAVHNNLGVLYYSQKQFERSRASHNQALRLRRRIYRDKPLHPDLEQTYENLALLHNAMGDARTARVYRDRVREIRRGVPPMSTSRRSHRSRIFQKAG